MADYKDFLDVLSKQALQLKKFVWCYIRFSDEPDNWDNYDTA
ncbi:UPF0228 family protein [Methanohalobium evestigatum]